MSTEDLLHMLARPLLLGVAVMAVILLIRRRKVMLDDAHGSIALVRLGHTADLVVPVRRLWNTAGLLGAHSNLSPQLWITADGLRFKVIRKIQEIRFASIREVHVSRQPVAGGARIFFHRPHWSGLLLPNYGLIADVSDIATARTVLQALPPAIPLSEAAARLRDP